jgi:hypothetical protein
LRDPNRRLPLGEAGRRRVADRYSIHVGLHGWRTLLTDLAAKRQAG